MIAMTGTVKRLVAIAALVLASGLMTTAGALVCLYGMRCCDKMTPACHEKSTEGKPFSCRATLSPSRMVSLTSARFTLTASHEARATAPVSVTLATLEVLVASPVFEASPPIVSLRV